MANLQHKALPRKGNKTAVLKNCWQNVNNDIFLIGMHLHEVADTNYNKNIKNV